MSRAKTGQLTYGRIDPAKRHQPPADAREKYPPWRNPCSRALISEPYTTGVVYMLALAPCAKIGQKQGDTDENALPTVEYCNRFLFFAKFYPNICYAARSNNNGYSDATGVIAYHCHLPRVLQQQLLSIYGIDISIVVCYSSKG